MNSLPTTVTRQRRDCDLDRGPSAPESSTLTTRLPLVSSRINFYVTYGQKTLGHDTAENSEPR